MKKKLLAFFVSTVMVLSLVACGGETDVPTVSDAVTEDESETKKLHFEVIVKSFQSTYWQAAVSGIRQACDELGVTAHWNGPVKESDVADQIEMLDAAIEKAPDGIGLAANDPIAVLASLQRAKEKGIPVVCFDTGVPQAPEGSVYATIATDNFAAGACAAENMYKAIKDKVAAATADAKVRICEINQDTTAQNIQERGIGFINKMIELITSDGKNVAVIGDEFYVNACTDKGEEATAEVLIEVGVPAQTTVAESIVVATDMMSKEDTIAVFGSNQTTAEGVIGANETLNVLGIDGIVAAGFDAGIPQKEAINAGLFIGSVTQFPLMQGYECIKTLYAICQGERVIDLPMNGYWYDTTNMTADNIAPNLYD